MSNIVPECSHLITYIYAWVPFISVIHSYFSINYFWEGTGVWVWLYEGVVITTAPVLCGKPFTCFQWCFTWNKTSYWSPSGHKRNRSFCQSEPASLKRMIEMMSEQLANPARHGFESEHMRLRLTGMYCVAEQYSLCAVWKTSFADLSRLCQHKAAVSTEM